MVSPFNKMTDEQKYKALEVDIESRFGKSVAKKTMQSIIKPPETVNDTSVQSAALDKKEKVTA